MPDAQTPTLYILCGLPGSGKTALANAIAKARDFAVVNLDHVKADEGYFVSDDEVPDADWSGIHDVVHAALLMPLRLGRSVVYDAANLKRSDRDDLRNLAASRGFPSRVIHVAVPDAAEAALTMFEEPAKDEDALVSAPSQDVAEWIKANL